MTLTPVPPERFQELLRFALPEKEWRFDATGQSTSLSLGPQSSTSLYKLVEVFFPQQLSWLNDLQLGELSVLSKEEDQKLMQKLWGFIFYVRMEENTQNWFELETLKEKIEELLSLIGDYKKDLELIFEYDREYYEALIKEDTEYEALIKEDAEAHTLEMKAILEAALEHKRESEGEHEQHEALPTVETLIHVAVNVELEKSEPKKVKEEQAKQEEKQEIQQAPIQQTPEIRKAPEGIRPPPFMPGNLFSYTARNPHIKTQTGVSEELHQLQENRDKLFMEIFFKTKADKTVDLSSDKTKLKLIDKAIAEFSKEANTSKDISDLKSRIVQYTQDQFPKPAMLRKEAP